MTQSITAYLDLEEESNPIVEVLDLGSIDSDPMVAILDLNVNSTIVPWGTIYGNIEDQLDLQEALYQLYPKSNPENYTSNKITFKIWYKEDTPEFIVVSDDEGNLVIDTDYVEVISDEGGNVVLSESDIHVTDDDNGNVFINSGE